MVFGLECVLMLKGLMMGAFVFRHGIFAEGLGTVLGREP